MAALNLKSLVSHLDDAARRALEAAAGLCLSRTHYNVEIEHWLWKISEDSQGDFAAIAKRFEIDTARFAADLVKALDRLKTGNARPPALAPAVVDLAREAWLVASLDFDSTRTRTGHIVLALVATDSLARQAADISSELERISPETLRREFLDIVAHSSEVAETGSTSTRTEGGARPATGGSTQALDQFTVDLTAQAKSGKIDPVLGRDGEIRQVIDILTRRRQNNPILTGEPGVGKTAVAEGFALRIAQGDVPPSLQNVTVRTLDLALLQAGAGIKGEFENRLKSVIEEVKRSPKPIILFIDEAHTMIGAGGSAGQGDAANILKPALARGELRTIAATTWAEYKKYFERDAALARRFQVVKVEEPDEKIAIQIMAGLVDVMERHHKVRVLDEAVIDSVRFSSRYITGRQLPDKSVSLLDTACARVALSQSAIPADIEDCRRRLTHIATATDILQRENATSAQHGEKLIELSREKTAVDQDLAALELRWKEERELVAEIRSVRGRLEEEYVAKKAATKVDKSSPQSSAQMPAPQSGAAPAQPAPAAPVPLTPKARAELQVKLEGLSKRLSALQGDRPLIKPFVDSQAIAEVVSTWTGIPVGRMVTNEIRSVLSLREQLEERVVGQTHAIEALAQTIRTSRANLTDPNRPIGVFMLVGTSGVGKTETAIALADVLYGGEQNMTVINMSEFKEEHKVSLLMGSPPGYVGYGEGGVLTEAVRRKPYSVLLLDELEKAHPGIQDVFYQVFDKGQMRDGEGRDIDFKNTVILMTTNVGTDTIMSLCSDPTTRPDAEGLREALRPELLKSFKPAFLGRVTVLPYFPLPDDVMKRIIALKLGKIGRRVRENYRATFDYTPELVENIAARCTEVESGARNVDHILTRTLLPELASEFLARMADGRTIRGVTVSVEPDGNFGYVIAEG